MLQLFALGSNGSGQLGIGHLEDVNTPTLCLGIPTDDAVVKVTGGGNHSAVLTASGKLFMSGFTQLGESHASKISQMKQEDKKMYMQFQQRFSHITWRDVACGWATTILVSDTGKVYGVGSSAWNELDGESSEQLLEIRLNNIFSVAIGWRHVIALDKHGQVYGWGWGRHNQLGPPIELTNKKDTRSIQKIELPQPIVQIACGHLHTLLRGKDGNVYGFGSNKYGQLGQGRQDHIVTSDSVQIDAGWHHGASLDNKGVLTVWGKDDHGQLANSQPLNNIKSFVCGSEHTLAVTSDKVIAWGWNEHGNCSTEQDFVVDPVVLTEASEKGVIGAGCAASWFAM